MFLVFCLFVFFLNEIAFHFRPCCVSLCLLRSTFLWKPLPQRSQANGLYPVCFLLCVMRLELWLNAFPHTWHLCGFSPKFKKKKRFYSSSDCFFFCAKATNTRGFYAQNTDRKRKSRRTCVDESVFLHVGLLVEPLPAVLARIGPRVRVDEQVRGQRGRPLKAFAADFAVEASFLETDGKTGALVNNAGTGVQPASPGACAGT